MNPNEHFMQLAIAVARKGILKNQTPFGACVVVHGEVAALAHNQVWSRMDITAHAEIMAIRKACRRLNSINLASAILYTTCEPCPMCFSACHWAGIQKIVYGAEIADAQRHGFRELQISASRMKNNGKSKIVLQKGILTSDCRALFSEWAARNAGRVY